jgi:hypothetical protein
MLLSSRGCFASTGPGYNDYVDPNTQYVELGAFVVIALILGTIFLIGWRERSKTGHWPSECISSVGLIFWYLLMFCRTEARECPAFRMPYDLIVQPALIGFMLASTMKALKKLAERELTIVYVVLLIFVSGIVVWMYKDFLKVITAHDQSFRYAMAAIAGISTALFYRFGDLLPSHVKSHEDGDDSAEGRGTSPIV